MENNNLGYILVKEPHFKIVNKDIVVPNCTQTCDEYEDEDYRTFCDNCKECYQYLIENYVIGENGLEEFRSKNIWSDELLEDYYSYKSVRGLLEPKCIYHCNDEYACSNCRDLMDTLEEVEAIYFCRGCYLMYNNLFAEGVIRGLDKNILKRNILSNDVIATLDLNICEKCNDLICPHYFSFESICDHCNFNGIIDKKYQIKKYIDNLKVNLHQKYMPGGMGFTDAQNHFNDIHKIKQ